MRPHKSSHWHEQKRPWLDHEHEHYHRPHGPIEVAPEGGATPDYPTDQVAPSMPRAGGPHELNYTVQSLDFTWDPAAHTLVFIVALSNGYTVNVAFPVSAVSAHFNALLRHIGYQAPPQLNGPIESLDGFFGSISQAFSSAGHAAESAFNHTIGSFSRHAVHYAKVGVKDIAHAGTGLARSRTFGAVLGGVAMVFPAVGGPALAAWSAAHTAVAMYDNAKRGQGDAQAAAQLQANIGQLQGDSSASAQLTIAGLQSVPAEPQQADSGQSDSSGTMTMPEMTITGSAGGSAEMGAPMYIPPPPPPPPPPQMYRQQYIAPPTGRYGDDTQQQSVGFHPREAVNGPFDHEQSVGFHPREAVATSNAVNPGNAVWDQQNGRWRHRYDHERVNQAYGTHALEPLENMAAPPPGYFRDVHGHLRLISEFNPTMAPGYIAPPPPQYHQDLLAAPPPPPPPPPATQFYNQQYTAPPAPPPPPPPPPPATQFYNQQYTAPPAPPPPPPQYFAQNYGQQPFRPTYYGHPYVAPAHPEYAQRFNPPVAHGYAPPPRMLAPSTPFRALPAPSYPSAVAPPPAAPLKIAAPSNQHGSRTAPPSPNLNGPNLYFRALQEQAQRYRQHHYPEQQPVAEQARWVWNPYQGRYVWQSWPQAA